MQRLDVRRTADRIWGTLERIQCVPQIIAEQEFSYDENVMYLEDFLDDLDDVKKEVNELLLQQYELRREDKEF